MLIGLDVSGYIYIDKGSQLGYNIYNIKMYLIRREVCIVWLCKRLCELWKIYSTQRSLQ